MLAGSLTFDGHGDVVHVQAALHVSMPSACRIANVDPVWQVS